MLIVGADCSLWKPVRTGDNQAAGRVSNVRIALLVVARIGVLVPGNMKEESEAY